VTRPPGRASRAAATAFTALAMVAMALPPVAAAGDLLGLYVGGAAGQGQLEADAGLPTPQSVRENHSGWKGMLGLRPIPLLGAEAEYFDLGNPSGQTAAGLTAISMHGTAAFAVLTLPVPVVDIFFKAGMARVQSTVDGTASGVGTCGIGSPNCAHFHSSGTNTSGAAGAGVGFGLGAWRIRAEYERFSTAGGNPSLATLGVTWTFL